MLFFFVIIVSREPFKNNIIVDLHTLKMSLRIRKPFGLGLKLYKELVSTNNFTYSKFILTSVLIDLFI